MSKIGLVLGAGGITGQAFHAGVLAALELDLGWDPRAADTIVGTSAGSLTGSLLRLGISAPELAGWAVGREQIGSKLKLLDQLSAAITALPAFGAMGIMRPWQWPSKAVRRHFLSRPWSTPVATISTLLPKGGAIFDRAHLADLSNASWPDNLLVCVTSREDGRRIVFDSVSTPGVDLASAVAASCAVPSYFAPVEIGGRQYIDGGLTSPTNADLLVGQDFDLVIIVSPLSAASRVVTGADAPLRWFSSAKLRSEVRALRASGTEVVCFEPSLRSRQAMGLNPMSPRRGPAILQSSFFDAGACIASPAVRRLLRPLDFRRRAESAA